MIIIIIHIIFQKKQYDNGTKSQTPSWTHHPTRPQWPQVDASGRVSVPGTSAGPPACMVNRRVCHAPRSSRYVRLKTTQKTKQRNTVDPKRQRTVTYRLPNKSGTAVPAPRSGRAVNRSLCMTVRSDYHHGVCCSWWRGLRRPA